MFSRSLICWIAFFCCQCLSQTTYDNGQWTTPEDTWGAWTPTTSYYQYYPTTTYSTWYSVYTQQNVIVTVTSLIPCPVTLTSTVYECEECYSTPQYTPPYQGTGVVQIGTTTVTSYTTVTAGGYSSYQPASTVTSGSNVVVIVGTTSNGQNPTALQFINEGRSLKKNANVLSFIIAIIASFLLLR